VKLYSSPLSPFTAKVRIALYEKGLVFEKINLPWHPVNGWKGKPAEMLAINPKGQVPTMVDGDVKLYDSTIIFEYLEDAYPSPPLFPTTVADRARCRLLEDMGDTIIAADTQDLVNEIFKKPDPATRDNAAIDLATSALHTDYARLERELASRDFLLGNFTVADISCFIPISIAAYLGVPPSASNPKLLAWIARMQQRPSIQRDLQEFTAALQDLAA